MATAVVVCAPATAHAQDACPNGWSPQANVLQANANVRDDGEDDEETGESGDRSEADQTMTDAFRDFA